MNALQRELATARMNQSELARRSGVSREMINRVCRDHTELMPAQAAAIAWALNIDVERLAALTPWIPEGPR